MRFWVNSGAAAPKKIDLRDVEVACVVGDHYYCTLLINVSQGDDTGELERKCLKLFIKEMKRRYGDDSTLAKPPSWARLCWGCEKLIHGKNSSIPLTLVMPPTNKYSIQLCGDLQSVTGIQLYYNELEPSLCWAPCPRITEMNIKYIQNCGIKVKDSVLTSANSITTSAAASVG